MNEDFEKIVEEGLRREPGFKLGLDFKDRVAKAIRRKEKISQRRFYVLILVGVILLFSAGVGVMAYFGQLESFKQLGSVAPLAVVIGGMVVAVQWLDKKLVKDKLIQEVSLR